MYLPKACSVACFTFTQLKRGCWSLQFLVRQHRFPPPVPVQLSALPCCPVVFPRTLLNSCRSFTTARFGICLPGKVLSGCLVQGRLCYTCSTCLILPRIKNNFKKANATFRFMPDTIWKAQDPLFSCQGRMKGTFSPGLGYSQGLASSTLHTGLSDIAHIHRDLKCSC